MHTLVERIHTEGWNVIVRAGQTKHWRMHCDKHHIFQSFIYHLMYKRDALK